MGVRETCGGGGTWEETSTANGQNVRRAKSRAGEGEESSGTAGNWRCPCIKSISLGDLLCCGILFYSIWKLMGVQNMTEFRQKVGRALPSVPRSPPKPGERTEFSGINDFLHYIIERDEVERREKRKQQQSNIEKPP